MIDFIINTLQLALIVFGFGVVVFIHELGHFLAARWAGVRVLAFAVGFGPAMCSYRRGLGVRRGSSEAEYQELIYSAQGKAGEAREQARSLLAGVVSPTEYRLNWLPLGGYVKMLGQDDGDPGHRSAEPDSFNVQAVWKRMIIISAGVVANIVSAAALFVIVFALGLEKPSPIIGSVTPSSPAEKAKPVSIGDESGVGPGIERGLQPGDRIISIEGKQVRSFDDAQMAVLTARQDKHIDIEIERNGSAEPITFWVTPEKTDEGILTIGIGPASTTTIADPGLDSSRAQLARFLAQAGLEGIGPGWTLTSIDGEAVGRLSEAGVLAGVSRGETLELTFLDAGGDSLVRQVTPEPAMQSAVYSSGEGEIAVQHLLGMSPVMTVGSIEPSSPGYKAGLRQGDIFVRLGGVDYPDAGSGIAAVRAKAGSTINASITRGGDILTLDLPVSRQGRVGFGVGGTDTLLDDANATRVANVPSLDPIVTRNGSRLLSINGNTVTRFGDIARLVQAIVTDGSEQIIELEFEAPITSQDGTPLIETVSLPLDETSASIGWNLPLALSFVEPDIVLVQSKSPIEAITMGLGETHRIMLTTYLTFARLAQGSISPQMLNGPVGIVHAGTNIADRGLAWLLFFFALISVNLAVINFLPIPITDGGHMIFLIWEQITGKPVSVVVQNIATLAGLVIIVGLFLFVTYNDVLRLIGS